MTDALILTEDLHLPGQTRHFQRVGVGLRVAIILARDTAYMASTTNVSEGGILVHGYSGPELTAGRLVGLNIRGVITDDGDDDPQQYLVRVVRCDGAVVALRFEDEAG